MGNVNVTIRMDAKLRKEATTLFEELGLSLNQALTIFVKQAVREQRIPFEITRNIPNKETLAAIAEVEEMEKHPEKYKGYDNVEELMEDLLKWYIS